MVLKNITQFKTIVSIEDVSTTYRRRIDDASTTKTSKSSSLSIYRRRIDDKFEIKLKQPLKSLNKVKNRIEISTFLAFEKKARYVLRIQKLSFLYSQNPRHPKWNTFASSCYVAEYFLKAMNGKMKNIEFRKMTALQRIKEASNRFLFLRQMKGSNLLKGKARLLFFGVEVSF